MKKIIVVIICALCSIELFSQQLSDQQLKKNLTRHVYTLAADSLMGRDAGSKQGLVAAQYIIKEFADMGLQPYSEKGYMQPFVVESKSMNNIIGVIQGIDPVLKNEYIILGAHYDHVGASNDKIYNGADDNASGTSVIIEAARRLLANRDKLRRSIIIVAFDGEEKGLLGSEYLADNMIVPLENVKAMVNMDMVGWLKAGGSLTYAGIGMFANASNIAKLTGNENIKVVYKHFDTKVMSDSDHSSFALKQIPAMYATTGMESPYHKPEDDAPLIDYDGLTAITIHVTRLMELLSTDEQLGYSGRSSFKHKGGNPMVSMGVTIGIGNNRHNYTSGALTGKTAFAGYAGFFAHIGQGSMFFAPELLYERRYSKHPQGEFFTDAVTVPVNFMVRLPKSGVVKLLAGIGGYYSYNFAGRLDGKSLDFKDTYNRHEGGLSCQLSLQVYNISLGYSGRTAFSNVMQKSAVVGSNMKNLSNYFSIGYFF